MKNVFDLTMWFDKKIFFFSRRSFTFSYRGLWWTRSPHYWQTQIGCILPIFGHMGSKVRKNIKFFEKILIPILPVKSYFCFHECVFFPDNVYAFTRVKKLSNGLFLLCKVLSVCVFEFSKPSRIAFQLPVQVILQHLRKSMIWKKIYGVMRN